MCWFRAKRSSPTPASRTASGGEFYGGPIVPDYEGRAAAGMAEAAAAALGRRLAADQSTEKTQSHSRSSSGRTSPPLPPTFCRVGGFDTRLGPGPHMLSPGEDTEIQERLLAHGVRGYYLPDAAMRHFVRAGAVHVGFCRSPGRAKRHLLGHRRGPATGVLSAALAEAYGQWLNDRVRIRRWRRSGDEPQRVRAECLAARGAAAGREFAGLELGPDADAPDGPTSTPGSRLATKNRCRRTEYQ